jgi:hypothetical protein
MSGGMLSRFIILGLALPLCSSNMTLSVTADQQSPTSATGAQFTVTPAAVPTPSATQVQAPSTAAPGKTFSVGAPIEDAPDWHLHLNVDAFTDEKTLIASTEYPLSGHTIKLTYSCVQQPELQLSKLPVYIEVTRYNSASDHSCKEVEILATLLEYRIDDRCIQSAINASRYCNTAKLVFGSMMVGDGRPVRLEEIMRLKQFINEEYSEIKSARRLRIRIKDQSDTNFDLDIDMSTPVIQQFVAQCPALSVKGVGQ